MHEPLKNGSVPLLASQPASANAFPPGKCLHEWFEVQSACTPDATALTFEQQHLTYRQLNERANQLAHHLRQLGVKPETLVGLFVERSLDLLVGLLGILKAGGAYVPMDPQYPQARLAFMMQDAGAAVIVTQENLAAQHPMPNAKLVCLDTDWPTIASEPKTNPANFTKPENLAYVIYTSGSTGTPKGSLISHHNVVRLFQATENWFHFNQGDVWTLFHSSAFDFSVWEIWGALLYGGRLVVVPFHTSRSPEIFRRLLCDEKVTVLNQTPSAFRQLLHADELAPAGEKLSLRYVIFGGEALDFKSLKPWFNRHGDEQPQLVNMYGITETTVHVTYRPIRAADTDSSSVIGVPIPDLQIYLLDENRQPVPDGTPGEICVGGTGVGRGYFNRPDLTAKKFISDPFSANSDNLLYCSGDLGRYLPNGDLEYLGRIDQQVKVRGFRIELGEIETVLSQHPSLRDSVVIARDDQLGEKQLVAYVVPKDKAPTVMELRAHLMQRLPDYMVPAAFVTLDVLPLTEHGKLNRQALIQQEEAVALATGVTYQAPRTELEWKLVEIWQGALQREGIGIRDDFFALGGHSLLVFTVISRIAGTLKLQLPVSMLFEHRTIETLARQIEADRSTLDKAPPLPRADRTQPLPMSVGQQQLWLVQQTLPDPATYNEPVVYHLLGSVAVACLKKSLEAIWERHEVLRTALVQEGESLVQKIFPAKMLDLPWEELDLRAVPASERQVAMERHLMEVSRRPFDLAQAPLWRVLWMTLANHEHQLAVIFHHAIVDEWSERLFFDEWRRLYAAEADPAKAGLAELPVQYADYAAWQRSRLTDEFLRRERAYWLQQLQNMPPPLKLPGDQSAGGRRSGRGGTYRFELSGPVAENLRSWAQQEGVTNFAWMLAAFQAWLYRFTGQADLVVGSPVTNREQPETQSLFGYFLNTLPLRIRVEKQESLRAFARRVGKMVQAGLEHKALPFEQMVAMVAPEPAGVRGPIYQVMFVLLEQGLPPWKPAGIEARQIDADTRTSKNDLTLFVEAEGAVWKCALEYAAEVFTEEAAARTAIYLQEWFASLAANPDGMIECLNLLPAAERRKIQMEWNATARGYPPDKCVHELFEEQVERTPEAIALEFEGQSLTYRELNQHANQLSRHLKKLGVGPETLVGLCVERSPAMVVGLLGILKAGGAYVPLDPDYPKARLDWLLKNAAIKWLITQTHLASRFSPAQNQNLICLDQASFNEPKDNLKVHGSPKNLAYVLFTSGSTGLPKGVAMEHGSLVNLLCWQVQQAPAPQRTLQFASVCFDVSFQEIFSTLINGGTLVLVNPAVRSNPAELFEFIQARRLERLFLPVVMLQELAEAAQQSSGAAVNLRDVITAGEQLRITPSIRRFFARHTACFLHNHYGPTESHVVTALPLPKNPSDWPELPAIGRPIFNTTIYLLDTELQPVPIGLAGELYIGGAGVARGYLNRPDLTAERFIPDPFSAKPEARLYKTGDLCRYLPDGNIEFLGRIDQQVKIRGFRVELGEIEAVLGTHPQVAGCAVVAQQNGGGIFLTAYVVTRAVAPLTGPVLREWLREKLPDYMVPARFATLPALPLTPNGKLDRQALGRLENTVELAASETYQAPRTELERKLVEIWQGLLGRESIGIHDNFFALGGHSLLAVRLVFRIQEAFGVSLPVKLVSECPTIAELSEALARQSPVKTISIPRRPRKVVGEPARYPASFSQEQLWFIDQLEPDSAVYNVPLALRLRGGLDQTRLTQSLNRVIARHEALRTIFAAEQGVPVQVVRPELKLPLAVTDLSGQPDPEVEAQRLMLQSAGKPFDLQRGPLVRAELFTLEAEDQILLLTIHHIVFDGWSIDVLLKDLAAGYAGEKLLPASLQYGDFAAWQRAHLTTQKVEQHLAYWREHLAGVPTVLELPTDQPRSGGSQRGAQHYFTLPLELTAQLRALAQQHNTTLFTTLLAAFQTLLHRFSGQQSILVGSPISGRLLNESENSIGFFVNMLPLKADFSGNPAFSNLLQQVHQNVWAAQSHQELPFERLVAELQPQRDPNRNPLFQAAFIFEVATPLLPQIPGLKLELEQVRTPTVKFDLTLTLAEKGGGLQCLWEYAAGTFGTETISRWSKYFETLLVSLVTNPDCLINDLDLLPAGERSLLLGEWSATAGEYARGASVAGLFVEQVKLRPSAVALSWSGGQLSYGELNERANQLAHHLRSLGVGLETPVGVLLSRSVDYVVSVLAILKAGGAYVPLDLEYPVERLKFMLADSGCKVVITAQDFKLSGATELNLATAAPSIAGCPKANLDLVSTAESLAYVIYTSGSTGQPKGVAIPQRGVVRLVRGQTYASFDSSQRFLLLAATAFDASTFELWAPLLNGGVCVLYPEALADYAHLEQVIREQNVTCLWLTAGLFNQIMDVRPSVLQTIKQVLAGGETLSVAHVRKALKLLPHLRLTNGYGPTESTTFACTYDLPPHFTGASVPIGRPLANTQCYVLDAQLQPVPVGVPGELYLGGDGLARGYLNRPELTAEKFIPNPFDAKNATRLYRTGDRVRWRAGGNLEFLGRLDNQVKLRGFRIELGEIESVLNGQAGVRASVVVARDNQLGEKQLVAYVVPKGTPPTVTELREHLLQRLPDYMVPAMFVTLEALPLTAHGKVDRNALPTPDSRLESGAEFTAPRNPTETKLAALWQELLGLKQISIHDNFFALGGHSLLAVRLVNEIKRQMSFDLPIRMVFQHPTIQELAKVLPEQKNTARRPELIQLQPGTAGPELFFLIDEGSLGLLKLAHFLNKDLRLYASVVPIPETTLRAAAKKDLSALPRMEEWAAKHVALIRSRKITGPIRLAGHCFGGMLAFEVARQLQAAGVRVETVLLLDTWMMMPTFWGVKKAWVSEHFGKLFRQGPKYLWRKSRRRIDIEKKELTSRFDLAFSDDFNVQIPWAIIARIYRHALQGYRPEPLATRGILFISQDDWISNAFRPQDNTLGARRVFGGGVTVVDVPGNHVTVLQETHLPALAEHYNRNLKPSP